MNAERIASVLAATFPGLGGRYLEQTATREGWSSGELSPAVFVRHVEGRERIGRRYDPARLAWCAFDLDGKKHPEGREWALATARRIVRALADLSIAAHVEQSRSGSGFHVWILFDGDGPSLDAARELAAAVLRTLALPDSFSEAAGVPGFYPWPPKAEGCGRVPYLPLHGVTNGKASGLFCDADTGEPFEDQLAALESLARTPRAVFDAALATLREIAPTRPKPERPRIEPRTFSGTLSPFADAALSREAARMASAPESQRHPTLFSAARNLGELVGGGELPRGLVESTLAEAATAAGLVGERTREVENTIRDGIAKGLLNPRAPEPERRRPASASAEEQADEVPAFDEPEWLREELDGPEDGPRVVTIAEPAAPRDAEPEAEPLDLDSLPEIPEACWRPGFAEFRAAWSRTTEAPDAFLWSAYRTGADCVLGRMARLRLGVEIFPNGYRANVGASGRTRKSTGQAKADRLLSRVDESVKTLHGIGSPEGLLDALAGDSGRAARVFVNLGELSTLLRKASADATRGLSPLLCTLFDCPPAVSLPNRQRPVEAREPFLCILGSTTGEWLRADLTLDDVRGGLAGRFEYFTGRSKAAIPLPPSPDGAALTAAENILRAARDRHATVREYGFDRDAEALFDAWYRAEHARDYGSPILDVLAQRLHVFAWKSSLVSAALEGTDRVTAEQVSAALAFADYQRETQRALFGSFGKSATQQTIDRVIAALTKHGPLSSREIAHKVRHVETEALSRSVAACVRFGLIEQRKDRRKLVWALIGQRSGNGSGNAYVSKKEREEREK